MGTHPNIWIFFSKVEATNLPKISIQLFLCVKSSKSCCCLCTTVCTCCTKQQGQELKQANRVCPSLGCSIQRETRVTARSFSCQSNLLKKQSTPISSASDIGYRQQEQQEEKPIYYSSTTMMLKVFVLGIGAAVFVSLWDPMG